MKFLIQNIAFLRLLRVKMLLVFLLVPITTFTAPHVIHNYACRHFDIRDGLAQMQVMSVFQDADGYMWFGTKNGLSRFDGNTFISYKKADGVPDGDIRSISQWGNDIVILTGTSISWFSPGHPFKTVEFPKNYVMNDAYGFPYSLEDKIFILNISTKKHTSNSELYILEYNRKKNTFQFIDTLKDFVRYIDNRLIISEKNIYYFNPDKNLITLSSLKLPQKCDKVIKNKNTQIYYLLNERQLTACKIGNNRLEIIGKVIGHFNNISQITLASSLRRDIYVQSSDNKRIMIFDKNLNYKFDFDPQMGFVNNLFFDKENNLWISGENGINCFSQLNFEEYKLGLAGGDMVWSINQDDAGNMYFGCYGLDLWKMDKAGQLKEIKLDLFNWNLQYFNSAKSSDGTLYFPYGDGVCTYKNNKFKNVDKRIHCTLCCYADDKTNAVYFGSVDSVADKIFVKKKGDDIKIFKWNESFIVSMAKDKQGKIRVGCFRKEGIFDGDSLYVVPVEKNAPDSGAISIAVDTLGRIWKGRLSGLYYEDLQGKNHHYLPSRIKGQIGAVLLYKNKYLLVGGEKSIFIVDIYNKYDIPNGVREFGYEDGFTGIEPGQSGFFVDNKENVWLACSACIIKFNPDRVLQSYNIKIPKLRIDALMCSRNNKDWQRYDLSYPVSGTINKSIELQSSVKYFRFEYIANTLTSPKSLRFKYRLKGFSEEWSQETYEKTVEFTNLGFGKYQFEVQCSLDGIHWSAVASSPEIQILAPFWVRWYMWLFYLLFFASAIIGITVYISKRKQKKEMELLSRQKLENELQLRTLHSKVLPHFTKNVLTAIGHFAMDDNRKAGKYIAMFSKFTQLTLANSDKNYNTLEEELNYIQTYVQLEQMRFGDRFSFNIEKDKNIDLNTNIPAMALHTYCDNAIRHGLVNKNDAGRLNVSVRKNPQGTLITVSDNGIGRKRSTELGTQGNGMGLKLVQQQIDFYNKMNEAKISQNIIDLQDDKGNALGTQIELFIPDGYKFSDEK